MLGKVLVLVLGAWIAGTLLMWAVATANFRTVDHVLSAPTPEAAPVLVSLPPNTRRPLLRHLVSELNRLFFRLWGGTQLVLAAVVLALFFGRAPRSTVEIAVAAALVVLVAAMLLGITPPIVRLGRAMDFLPRDTPPPQMAAFGKLHAAYSVLDLTKILLLIALTGRVLRSP